MAFGQTAGPPASPQQLTQLLQVLQEAGYESFREARHPFGLSQRQSNGKFTRHEAAELIDRLAGAGDVPLEHPRAPEPTPTRGRPAGKAAARDAPAPDTVAMAFPDELLAEELVRRGWTCTPPPAG